MSITTPSYYESVTTTEVLDELQEPTTRPTDHNADQLPFSALGGRRFEILTYLLLESSLNEQDAHVTLVKSSGDRGRDVLVHRGGRLASVVQCKNLEAPLTRPTLVRELAKLMLFNIVESFLPDDPFTYEFWAPGGFTQPAHDLIAEWPNGLEEKEMGAAFDACTKSYSTLKALKWDSCAEELLLDKPTAIQLAARDGYRLSADVRDSPPCHSRFFEATIVMRKEDVEAVLDAKLLSLGIGKAVDEDVQELVTAIGDAPPEYRTYLGPYIFGLSPHHFAIMSAEERAELSTACMDPTFAAVKALATSLPRHAQERVMQAAAGMSYGSSSFKYILQRSLATLLLNRLGALTTPAPIRGLHPMAEFDSMGLREIVDKFVTETWSDFQKMEAQYNPAQHPPGSDEWLRARISATALLGVASKEEFDGRLRADIDENWEKILDLEKELLELIPERILVVADSKSPMESKETLVRLARDAKAIEDNVEERSRNPPVQDGPNRGVPTLDEVTWSVLPYRKGAFFRGYNAGLVFRGHNFSESLEHAKRRKGDGPPAGHADYFWQKLNQVQPNYAELSTGGDELEGPLSWRDYEFCVRNSAGLESAWVEFSYDFDIEALERELARCEDGGMQLRSAGKLEEADDLLRRAFVFSDRLYGRDDPRTKERWQCRETNLDELLKARLRFDVGDHVRIVDGPHKDRAGRITRLLLRHHHAYLIEDDADQAQFQAADSEVTAP